MKPTSKMYYNRVIDPAIEALLLDKYRWLIQTVIENPELDFQTISSKVSIYRGTSSIASLNKKGEMTADKAYMTLYPDFYNNPTSLTFTELLNKVHNDRYFDSYYQSVDKKMEGYYQNLISRRYTLNCKPSDDFIIIDKEFVIGYKDQSTKDTLLEKHKIKYDGFIRQIKEMYPSERWPKTIKQSGEECDFLAITKDGDILLLELKRSGDTQKIYLSPLQVEKYADMTKALLDNYSDTFFTVLKEMVEQKKRIGIINSVWEMPQKLSGNIKTAVVVGGNSSLEAKRKFQLVRDIVGKKTPYYTCNNDGTLIEVVL